MADIRDLTYSYIKAFDAKDINAVAEHLSENFTLTDPEVSGLQPKAAVLEYIQGLFDGNTGEFSFTPENVFVDGNSSVIEFTLVLGETTLKGADLITWDGAKMASMRAHLTVKV